MKKLILALALISPVLLYGQLESDRDGDGITDIREYFIHKKYSDQKGYYTYFNPDIADIPSAAITFTGSINVGLVYSVKSTTETKKTIEINQTKSIEVEDYKKTYNSNTVKNKTEAEVSAGFSIKGFMGGFSIKNNFTSDATSGIEIRKEQIDKWKDDYKNLQSQINNNQIGYDEDDGYIRANLNFFNPSSCHSIKISKVIINAYAYNITTGQKDDKPLLQAIEVNLKPNGANEDDINEIILDKLEVKNRLISIKKLNSNDIIQMLNDGKSIIFEIESYDISVQDVQMIPEKTISLSKQKDALSRDCFKLRIFDGKSDVTYYIAKKDSTGDYNTLRKALKYIYNDNVSFNQTTINNEKFNYIYNIDNKMSNLNFQVKPINFTKENLSQGFWFKLIKEGTTFSGDLDAPLNELNIDITLVYLTGNDLKPIPKNDFAIIGNKSADLINNDPISTGIFITKGDKINLDITPYVTQFSQGYVTEIFSFYGIGGISDITYHRSVINEEWKFQKLSKSEILKINLYFKFSGIEKIFRLSDFKNVVVNFSPSNTWNIQFNLPDIIQQNIKYEIILLPQQNSFAENPITLNEGLLTSDYENLKASLISLRNQGCPYGICDRIEKFLNNNFYKSIIKYQTIKYSININALRQL